MPTGIVKILYTHAHTANAHTLAHPCTSQIQNYSVNPSTVAARPMVDSGLLAARPTLHLGCDIIIAASSTQPHPYNHRANMHYHLTLCLYCTQSCPTLRTVELTYTTIALAYTQLTHTIRIPYTTVSNTREVKRRHRRQLCCYCLMEVEFSGVRTSCV